ncbi:MAG: hypothetical protein R3F34_00525 [Planctomycetota bacterium]
MSAEPVLVGVDGGGSGVRAARVVRTEGGLYDFGSAFVLRAIDAGSDARTYVRAAADVVAEVADGAASVLFGMGMPGRKTEDGRGIAYALHGPVDVEFLAHLESALGARGVRLAASCARLDDDGLLGCAGERLSPRGALRDANDAYYLGGGTGLAEAFVVAGEPTAFEDCGRGLSRAWRQFDGEMTFEERLSVRALNQAYRRAGGRADLPEVGLAHGESAARETLTGAIQALQRLVARREEALGLRFDRIAISQRLASVFATSPARDLLEASIEGTPLEGRVAVSEVRGSAVVGAGAMADRRRA